MVCKRHFISPTWEIIENFRLHLAKKKEKSIFDIEIAVELNITRESLAGMKHKNTLLILKPLGVYCIVNNLDIRDFVKYSHSKTIN